MERDHELETCYCGVPSSSYLIAASFHHLGFDDLAFVLSEGSAVLRPLALSVGNSDLVLCWQWYH